MCGEILFLNYKYIRNMKFNDLYQIILESLEGFKVLSFDRKLEQDDPNPEYHEAFETYEVEVGGKKYTIVLTIHHLRFKGEEDVDGIKVFDYNKQLIHELTSMEFAENNKWNYTDKDFYKMPKKLAFLQPVINSIGGIKYQDRPQYYKLDRETRDTWQEIIPGL